MQSLRAFLSHSSNDKTFAAAVANELDRAGCVYDAYDFQTGADFSDEIVQRLAESGIFVLLASRSALNSRFVQLETERARLLAQGGLLSSSLVFLIDDAITHHDVPGWLRNALVTRAKNAKHVAQEIQRTQGDLIRQSQTEFFVNRTAELTAAQRYFNPLPPAGRPKLAIFYGPIGFGRRTLARRVLTDVCGIRMFNEFLLQSGDDTADLAIKLARVAETYNDTGELEVALAKIRASDNTQNLLLIDEYLNVISAMKAAPFFVDGGGMINPDGSLSDVAHNLAGAIQRLPGVYSAFVSRRKPSQDFAPSFPCIRLTGLPQDDIRDLLSSLLSRDNIAISQAQLQELAEYSAGYPPSAAHAGALVREYGIDKLLADKRALVQTRINSFTSDLRDDRTLTQHQQHILATLASYSPMPLRELAYSVKRSSPELAGDLSYLIDTAFVYPDEYQRYALSEPLIEAVARVFEDVEPDHRRVSAAFETLLQGCNDLPDRLSLERIRFRAFAAENSAAAIKSTTFIALANDFIDSCVKAYRDQQYAKALDMARFAVDLRPSNLDANRVLIQSLVKRRRFDDARNRLSQAADHFELKEVRFFSGFILKGEGNFKGAIVEYQKAVTLGRRDIAINRTGDLLFSPRRSTFRETLRGSSEYRPKRQLDRS